MRHLMYFLFVCKEGSQLPSFRWGDIFHPSLHQSLWRQPQLSSGFKATVACRVRCGLQFWAEHVVESLPSVPVTLYLMPKTRKRKDKISYYYFEGSNQWLKACFIFKWNLNQIVFLESEWTFAVWSMARGWCTMLPGWEQCHLGGLTAAGLAVRR